MIFVRTVFLETILRWIFALGIMFLLTGLGDRPPDEIVVGAVLPMTGDAATFGQNAARGAELAVAEATAKELLGAAVRIRLVVEDSRGNPADAVAAVRKLIEINHASVLIGDVTSAGTHAMIPIVTAQKIPLISPSASDPGLSGSSPYFARVWPSDVYEANVIGDYAVKQKFSRIALIYANTDYGVGMVKAFRATVPGDVIGLDIPVDRGLVDFRPTLKRIQFAKADALFVVLYPEDAKRLLGQLMEIEKTLYRLPILATATFEDPMVAKSPGAERIVFASPVPPDDHEFVRSSFIAAYKKKFGSDPGVLSDTGYDAANILIAALVQANSPGGQSIMQYIYNLREYPGASGTMSFDDKGDVRKPYGLKTVRNQTFVWLNQD